MNEVRFVTREIGSLAKPGWRVKSIAGRPVEESDVEDARAWGDRLGVENVEELTEILRKGTGFSVSEKVIRLGAAARILKDAATEEGAVT